MKSFARVGRSTDWILSVLGILKYKLCRLRLKASVWLNSNSSSSFLWDLVTNIIYRLQGEKEAGVQISKVIQISQPALV